MDVSCSLDVLVRQESPLPSRSSKSDPLKDVVRSTHEKMERAFHREGKLVARRKIA